jgi:hypothetical protein
LSFKRLLLAGKIRERDLAGRRKMLNKDINV